MHIRLIGKKWVDSSYHKKEVNVADYSCLKKDCLHPHDYGYRSGSGRWVQQLRCFTREKGGC